MNKTDREIVLFIALTLDFPISPLIAGEINSEEWIALTDILVLLSENWFTTEEVKGFSQRLGELMDKSLKR